MIHKGLSFNLTTPCATCPFRTDIRAYLTKGRINEIEGSLVNGVFPCHNTMDYSHNDGDGEEDIMPKDTEKTAHCAGALILLEKLERSSQMMRIAERTNGYDPSKLKMDAPIFENFQQMRRAQPR